MNDSLKQNVEQKKPNSYTHKTQFHLYKFQTKWRRVKDYCLGIHTSGLK